MSEPQAEDRREGRGQPKDGAPSDAPAHSSALPQPGATPLAQAIADASGKLHPGAALEPTDDQPTVISRHPPRPLRAEDLFAGSLRGRKLAHFELIEPIGVGGMAAVLRARDTQLDRIVALKILPPDMTNDDENVRRFHQEARAAAKLDHENIARVFFCGEDQKLHFIAFEFVEGQNLRVLLDRRGRLPVPDAVHYLLQIATGLSHAALRGVVHRDIKPSNIIISPNGRAKLVDMGLARSMEPQADKGLTQSGVTLGTFDYISPEQALEPRDADVRSDIYSLGCTFYHALTGQAPVPEGTAAKKLHHHQNVQPLDPRQLNPEIPDDVAAILGRMMAKDPKERYQDADQLVQHLLIVAQRLGGVADVPDGPLFVDAPLPNPPAARPVLMAAVAAVLLICLILLLGQQPPWATEPPVDSSPHVKTKPSGEPSVAPGTNGGTRAATGDPKQPKEQQAERQPAVARYESDKPTAQDLDAFLRANASVEEMLIVLGGDLRFPGNLKPARDDMSMEPEPTPTLLVRGRKVTIRARSGARTPTIWFEYDGRTLPPGSLWAALTVQARDEVRLKGLRFVVDAARSETNLTGLLLQGPLNTQVVGCEFIQARPENSERARLSSAVVQPLRAETPTVTFRECYFVGGRGEVAFADADRGRLAPGGVDRGGHEAVTVFGKAQIKAINCAFGPHAALFSLVGKTKEEIRLELASCSAFLADESAAFVLDKAAAYRLKVEDCLFSHPGGSADNGDAVLIRQNGEAANLHYLGNDNRYHNLSAFWVNKSAPALDAASFLREIKERRGQDEKSQVLATSPWMASNPLSLLENNEPLKAFDVNEELASLRQGGDGSSRFAVGVKKCVWGSTRDLRRLTEPVVAARKKRIIDPKVESGNGVYTTLLQALQVIEQGDEILIRHNGLLKVPPIERGQLDVTIKPDAGYHPILTLGETSEREASLFRLHAGKLVLEGLEFLLQPRSGEFKSQSVVTVLGDGQCVFKDCVTTLIEDPKGVALSVLTFADPATVVNMTGVTPTGMVGRPRVQWKGCFIRGEGDLIGVRASRPFDLEMDNSLIALTGSFLDVEGRQDDIPAPAPAIVAKMENVTAYLVGSLLRLRSVKDIKGVAPVQLHPGSCLFVSAGGNALIHLEGMEPSDQQMRHLLSWEGHGNHYGNFMRMLDQKPRDDGMMMAPRPFDQEKWRTFFGENDGQFVRGKFDDLPAREFPLFRTLPIHFKTEAQGYGVDIGLVPQPADAGAERTRPD